jgi:maltose alpha-D-glucosyltransferase/alpha-amylase
MMLAEANITMDEVDEYFGDGDRLHVIFNFMLNQHTFLALARKDAEPIRRVMAKTPPLPPTAQWATFLRNHDELDLGRLTDEERQEVFGVFGPEPYMQAYERGIRRRLAPMLGGDDRRLKLALSLMFALPGTPVLWYGDEIGMGEDLSLEERNSVRTPMQWSDDANAGFSDGPSEKLVRPVVSEGDFAYDRVNAQAQREVTGSLLETVQRLVRVRRACPEIGWGEYQVLEAGSSGILALRSDWRGGTVITVHNLSGDKAAVRLSLDGVEQLRLLYCDGEDRAIRKAGEPIEIEAYGFRWFRAGGERR